MDDEGYWALILVGQAFLLRLIIWTQMYQSAVFLRGGEEAIKKGKRFVCTDKGTDQGVPGETHPYVSEKSLQETVP